MHTTDSSRPCVEVTHIDDSATVNAQIEFFDQDLVSLPSSIRFAARQVLVRLDGVNVIFYSSNVRVRTRPSLHKSHLGFVVFGPGASGTVNGMQVREGSVVAVPAAQTIALVAEPGHESAGFLVPHSELAEHLSTHGQKEVLAALQRVELRQLEPDQTNSLFDFGKRLIDSALDNPDLFNASSNHRRAARADVLEMLAKTLTSSVPIELERRERTRLMQSHIVRAAEEHALAHCSESLYVKDLCQAAGVSERTLEYAFKAEMGLSPTAYLSRLRLHKVRDALLQAATQPTTVTGEALRWGFWQFGDFAKSYRQCFNELPSDTLRRALGD